MIDMLLEFRSKKLYPCEPLIGHHLLESFAQFASPNAHLSESITIITNLPCIHKVMANQPEPE